MDMGINVQRALQKQRELYFIRSKHLIVTLPQRYLPVTSITIRKFIPAPPPPKKELQGRLCFVEVSSMSVCSMDNTAAVQRLHTFLGYIML